MQGGRPCVTQKDALHEGLPLSNSDRGQAGSHYTLYTSHSTPLPALYILHSTPYSLHFTLHTFYFTYSLQSTLFNSILRTPFSTLCTLHSTLCTFTLHLALHILDFELYTPHSTLSTSHSAIPSSHSTRHIPNSRTHFLHTRHLALHPLPLSTVYSALVGKQGKHGKMYKTGQKLLSQKSVLRDCIQTGILRIGSGKVQTGSN